MDLNLDLIGIDLYLNRYSDQTWMVGLGLLGVSKCEERSSEDLAAGCLTHYFLLDTIGNLPSQTPAAHTTIQ
jgi:hypothetical protein